MTFCLDVYLCDLINIAHQCRDQTTDARPSLVTWYNCFTRTSVTLGLLTLNLRTLHYFTHHSLAYDVGSGAVFCHGIHPTSWKFPLALRAHLGIHCVPSFVRGSHDLLNRYKLRHIKEKCAWKLVVFKNWGRNIRKTVEMSPRPTTGHKSILAREYHIVFIDKAGSLLLILLIIVIVIIISTIFRFQMGTGDREKKLQTSADWQSFLPLCMAIGHMSGEHFELVMQWIWHFNKSYILGINKHQGR